MCIREIVSLGSTCTFDLTPLLNSVLFQTKSTPRLNGKLGEVIDEDCGLFGADAVRWAVSFEGEEKPMKLADFQLGRADALQASAK